MKGTGREPCAIIMPTCARHAHFAELGARSLDALWPGHQPLWIISGGWTMSGSRVVCTERRDWVGAMDEGLGQLLARGAIAASPWVLVVLEDHAPTRPVKADVIAAAISIAEERGADYVKLDAFYGSVMRLDGAILGHRVAVMNPHWQWYHSLQPAAWRVGHLMTTLSRAAARGALDPWSFEEVPWNGRRHLAVESVWPSAHGGFLARGRVNIRAVLDMRHPASRELRWALIREWLPEMARRRLGGMMKNLQMRVGADLRRGP